MKIKIVFYFAIFLISSFLLSGCILESPRWTGVYYPTGLSSGLDDWVYSSMNQFESFEDCVDWIHNIQSSRGYPIDDDWECGSDCEWTNEALGYMTCHETRDY